MRYLAWLRDLHIPAETGAYDADTARQFAAYEVQVANAAARSEDLEVRDQIGAIAIGMVLGGLIVWTAT